MVRRGSSEDSTGCCFVAPTGATQLSSVVSFVRFIFLMTTRAIFFTAYPDYIIIKMPLDSPFAVTVELVAFSVPCVKKKKKMWRWGWRGRHSSIGHGCSYVVLTVVLRRLRCTTSSANFGSTGCFRDVLCYWHPQRIVTAGRLNEIGQV